MEKISIKTNFKTELQDITSLIKKIVAENNIKNGFCILYVPHTTASLIINENADPAVKRDILAHLSKLIPLDANYTHLEGNAAAHIKSSIVGQHKILFIQDKKLLLGTWQGIFFAEFDGPRNREIWIEFYENKS